MVSGSPVFKYAIC